MQLISSVNDWIDTLIEETGKNWKCGAEANIQWHIQVLQQLCRVCGQNSGNGVDKESYSSELFDLFSIDVSKDHASVHPARLCSGHRQLLYRYRGKRKSRKKFRTDTSPQQFEPHSDNCSICSNPNSDPSLEKDTNDVQELVSEVISFSCHKRQLFFDRLLQTISHEDLEFVATSVGSIIKSQIAKDADTIVGEYSNFSSLVNLDPSSWLKQRNSVLTSFLNAISNGKCRNHEFLTACTLEQIYKLGVPRLVSPFAFLQNLSIYMTTGSKFATNILGKSGPGGCYQTVLSWLKTQATTPPGCPSGDVFNVFDNEQVIGRKNQIAPHSKATVSVITNKAFIQLNSKGSNLQGKKELSPTYDRNSPELLRVATELFNESGESFTELQQAHMEQLTCFIQTAIQEVVDEQMVSANNSYSDKTDQEIKDTDDSHVFITCAGCGTRNPRRKIICTGCFKKDGIKATRESKKTATAPSKPTRTVFIDFNTDKEKTTISQSEERYSHIPSNHAGKTQLILSEPVFCNPNSMETVAKVLRRIGMENNIARYGGTKRHWTFVCCDGLPFTICKKLKQEAVICSTCEEKFLNKEAFTKHLSSSDHAHIDNCYQEFDWFYLRIGAGHYEMNLIKSFFELNWTPFLENLCETMGFVSPKAKQYAKACKDHHKSWSLLLTFHLGALRELVLPYVRQCLSHKSSPTAEGFLAFMEGEYSYPNAQYFLQQVCRFSQGIINFRMAIRRNNAELLRSAKHMTKELFFGRHHPKYQEIQVFDDLQYRMMPTEVQKVYDQATSGTTSGHISRGQDFDFLLEEKNRQLKDWIPRGIPSDETWLMACRNNAQLEKISMKFQDLQGINKSSFAMHRINTDSATDAWRKQIRMLGYLQREENHSSIDGKELDPDLCRFVETAQMRRSYYIETGFLGLDKVNAPTLQHPVYVTPDERAQRNARQNRTTATLKHEMLDLVASMSDHNQAEVYRQKLASARKFRKEQLLILYEDIEMALSEMVSEEESTEESTE